MKARLETICVTLGPAPCLHFVHVLGLNEAEFKEDKLGWVVVLHAFNLSTLEAEAGRSLMWDSSLYAVNMFLLSLVNKEAALACGRTKLS